MKKKLALMMAGVLAAMSLAACGGGSQPAATTAAAELNLIIASNQTSEENPYSIGMEAFKTALEEVSGGKATATVHKGTLGENESELVEKLSMGAADLVVASPGFMTAIGVPEVDFFSLYYIFESVTIHS